jgi:hypothetical protein
MLCFLTLGILLEGLHGFKVDWYLQPAFETRRLMWTLGHAHGTLLALVHVAFAASVLAMGSETAHFQRWVSPCLVAASLLLPGGFFLGGIYTYAGDPGIGVLLVPLGALLLFAGVLATALAVTRSTSGPVTETMRRKTTKRIKRV